MLRRGTLGLNEIRFQVRMYLDLQYATNHGVLHTGSGAMQAFENAVDSFGIAKVPRFASRFRFGQVFSIDAGEEVLVAAFAVISGPSERGCEAAGRPSFT